MDNLNKKFHEKHSYNIIEGVYYLEEKEKKAKEYNY